MKQTEVPFTTGQWVIDRNNPGNPGQFTGNTRTAGPHMMVQLRYPDGTTQYRPRVCLEGMPESGLGTSLAQRLAAGNFGKLRDLQRLITYEKLRGTLHEVIYSMEAAQIDFYPYQFKPVLKFINSPTERLVIADEVGLGKTIESALIWLELQARRQAKRLLVVCPKILAEKWRSELRTKFLFDAQIVSFRQLEREMAELITSGPGHPFMLIATYTGLRPPRADLRLLRDPPDADQEGGKKSRLLRQLRHWSLTYDPFDLVIFDEAHYMRNPGTTVFRLGEALSANAGAVLCVSATPVQNSNTDLHTLLRLIDESFFESEGVFDELLLANRPAVQASNALARLPLDANMLKAAVAGMAGSRFISSSPLFKQFRDRIERLEELNKSQIAKCQDLAEKLNLLGGYINRTRRIQVAENRPVRDPIVLPVTYSPQEMQLYKSIVSMVRAKCQRDDRVFHVFQVIGLQLRAASSLPVLAEEMRRGRFGEPEELLSEALGDESYDEVIGDDEFREELDSASDFSKLLGHDFEADDSKYRSLHELLAQSLDEKVVIFAFYRGTLSYLQKRLEADGFNVTLIHGGIDNERRWQELDRFRDPQGPRILLSSEVGSEGIDLQFCRVMINYDLPWNPMRIEQRIGRIDRVGQQAKRLSIVNFKVKDTIEERLYDRLHSKLERFANSLGDLESIIGREVQNLTVELFSRDLTPEQEQAMMEQSESVIEQRLVQIQALEESGDALVALGDYLQKQITEDRALGRFIQPEEIEDYVVDFFEREFPGSTVDHNTPAHGCLRLKLSYDAQSSLGDFIRDDKSLAARPLRGREFALTFRREIREALDGASRKSVHFANHLSPLVRWMTKINQLRTRRLFDVSAAQLVHPTVSKGTYCYRIERWHMEGLSNRETLAHAVCSLEGAILEPSEAEALIQQLLRLGSDWNYVDVDISTLVAAHDTLEEHLASRFSIAVEEFEAENTTAQQIKTQRVCNVFDRRIAQDEQRLQTLREARRDPRIIRLTEGRLNAARENKNARLQDLKRKATTDFSQIDVAAGVFRVAAEE